MVNSGWPRKLYIQIQAFSIIAWFILLFTFLLWEWDDKDWELSLIFIKSLKSDHNPPLHKVNRKNKSEIKTQPAITCSKLTIETVGQGMKYVQSIGSKFEVYVYEYMFKYMFMSYV